MGSCISKCRPKKHSQEDVQDKLVVISQAPKNISISNKISPSPPSPTPSNSTSSISSTIGTNTSTSCSSFSSSASSSSSSILSSKERSFSNEFLFSCAKENPHVIRINSIKNNHLSSKIHVPKIASPDLPQKRSSTPATLTRQKSFRKEAERLRTPSPSRRYSGEKSMKENCSKRVFGSRENAGSSSFVCSSQRRENFFRPASPGNCRSGRFGPCLRHKESCNNQKVGSRIIDEIAVGKVIAHHDIASIIPLEDIDNPLISLDCFIFL